MVVDGKCLKIISSCCVMSDILDEGVELIELINKKRQPMKSKNVIYMLSDDIESIDLLLDDYRVGKEMYGNLFIIFNYHLSNDVNLRKIANVISMDRILGCVELHLNFVPYEDNIFHSCLGFTLFDIYPRYSRNLVDSISSRIASVCSVLNINPRIRFQRSKYGISEAVSKCTLNLLSSLNINDVSCDYLLILERCIDFNPIFIHEYTYQAFVYDMLNVPCCSRWQDNVVDDSWEFKLITNVDSKEMKTAILSSYTDQLWERYRHLHIQEVNKLVLKEIDEFSRDKNLGPTSTIDKRNISNTLSLVRKLPQVQYLLEKYWAHVNISECCFDVVERLSMLDVGNVEQLLSTGMDKNGKSLSNTKTLQQLNTVLCNVNITEEQKIRLMLLYVVNYRNITRQCIEGLIDDARISLEGRRVLESFMKLIMGFDCTNYDDNDKIIHSIEFKSEIKSFYKKRLHDLEYELSRFIPEFIHVVKKLIQGKLKLDLYPSINKFDPSPISDLQGQSRQENKFNAASDDKNIISPNKRNDNYSNNWGIDKVDENEDVKDKPKLIIYIIGGITFSECREVYKMNTNFKIYLGGDTIIIPSNIIKTNYNIEKMMEEDIYT